VRLKEQKTTEQPSETRHLRLGRKAALLLAASAALATAVACGTSQKAAAPSAPAHSAPVSHAEIQPQAPKRAEATKPAPQATAKAITAVLHKNVSTTMFYIGEDASPANDGIPNQASTYDDNWERNFGGQDTPNARNGYWPAAFKPKENPFYAAVPYSDLYGEHNTRRVSGINCLILSGNQDHPSAGSWCKNIWIKITNESNMKIAFAQIEDAGPQGNAIPKEDDENAVFNGAQPLNSEDNHVGLDTSPAIQTYLGLTGGDVTDYQIVKRSDVTPGPWLEITTISVGHIAGQ
jgi:hypothetical protein